MKAFITRNLPEEALAIVRSVTPDVDIWPEETPPPYDALVGRTEPVDGVLCLLTDRIDEALLQRAPRLRVVSQMAVGYDNIDVPACTAHGVAVGNTPGVLTETTADLTFALLLAAARRIVEADHYTRSGAWTTWSPLLLTGFDVHHATLGVIGMGRIGLEVARRATGFQMSILYTGHRRCEAAEEAFGARQVDLETLLCESDFVSVHVPLSAETRRLIGEAELRRMKRTAVLINTARGPIVDPGALYRALRDGEIAAAALDVFDTEPVPADEPLLRLPNLVVAPHIGSASRATRTRMAVLAAENLVAGLAGRPLPHPVNPEVVAVRATS